MNDESQQREDRSRFGVALIAGGALAILIVVFLFLFSSRSRTGSGSEPLLPFGPAEQAYAANIQLANFSMSRAENFVHQEVTMLSGEVANAGDRALSEIEVTVEFRDSLNQVVLRESRRILGLTSESFAPNQRRSFLISFEHIPTDWNHQTPTVRVTGLQFA